MKRVINADGTSDLSGVEIKPNDKPLLFNPEKYTYKDEVHASLGEVPKVSFEVFKNEYFPGLLAQDIEVRNKWIDYVGSFLGRVDLVDKDGNVISWVPPISYGLVSASGSTLDSDAYDYKKMVDVHAGAANARLAKSIARNVMTMAPPRSHIEQWKSLIYLCNPERKITADPNQAVIATSDDEYEEW